MDNIKANRTASNMFADLALDEALLTVNKSPSIRSHLDVYYQIDECFGCPLEKLRTLEENPARFSIGTKFALQLELRNSQDGQKLCTFDSLELNNHGHYQIDLSNQNQTFSCNLQTLSKGECLLCPLALLLCLLIGVTVLEKVYTIFLSKKSRAEFANDQTRLETGEQKRELEESQESSDEQVVEQVQLERRKANRVEALDAFRGLTIAGMIFVNYGGAGYKMLEHKAWNGITLADFVFPFFIFSMGASIALSSKSMMRNAKSVRQIFGKILRRSLILLTLGLCLNSKWLTNDKGLQDLRLTGVLQRFSISYLVVALIYTSKLSIQNWIKAQSLSRIPWLSKVSSILVELLAALNLLAIYLYVSFFLHYSENCPAGYLGPGGLTEGGKYANCTGGAAAWLDRLLLGERHLYDDHEVRQIFKTQVSHDPEGVLGE